MSNVTPHYPDGSPVESYKWDGKSDTIKVKYGNAYETLYIKPDGTLTTVKP